MAAEAPCALLGLGTAAGPHAASQIRLGERYAELLERELGDRRAARRSRLLFRAARIETRSVVLPELVEAAPALLYEGRALPSTEQRLRVFALCAPELAERAARRALERAGVAPSEVVQLVVASCTGVGAPDLDVELAMRLGLPAGVERTQIVWMSCTAGFPALRVGRRALAARHRGVALVVCVELCSLHVRADPDLGSQLAHSLFADGAAAAVLSPDVEDPRALVRLGDPLSELLVARRKLLTWSFTDAGFRAHVDSQLPGAIGAQVERFALRALDGPRDAVASWCVHPGGAAILDRVSAALGLPEDALESARAVLREHGNMSSATVLFVLERELARLAPGERGLLLGFGTGLTLEALPFRRGPGAG